MTRSNHARAKAHRACRSRRCQKGERRPAWVHPLLRAHRAVASSIRLLTATFNAAVASAQCAQRRPVRSSQDLHAAWQGLVRTAVRLKRAAKALDEADVCIAREPEHAAVAEVLLLDMTLRFEKVTKALGQVADEVFAFHESIRHDLETGVLVPEEPAEHRPRIVLAPFPVPIRAFLLCRQRRVVDRIAAILRRRRRIPRPASIRVPRRSPLGRAPPLSLVCPL